MRVRIKLAAELAQHVEYSCLWPTEDIVLPSFGDDAAFALLDDAAFALLDAALALFPAVPSL